MSPAGEPVLAGVTYWSRDLGPYVWHRFDPERVQHDLRAIADCGLSTVRTLLPWDVFMPAVARPDAAALRNLETLLTLAAAAGLRVIPVLFAQAVGDCVFLRTTRSTSTEPAPTSARSAREWCSPAALAISTPTPA